MRQRGQTKHLSGLGSLATHRPSCQILLPALMYSRFSFPRGATRRMKMRSTCATSCQRWGTSPRGCSGAGACRSNSETGTAASPGPRHLTAASSKIGFTQWFCFVLFLFAPRFVHFLSPAPALPIPSNSHNQRGHPRSWAAIGRVRLPRLWTSPRFSVLAACRCKSALAGGVSSVQGYP